MVSSYVLLCFSLLALSSRHFLANADLITETCEQTLYKDVCESVFTTVPESKTADLHGLAKIALDLAAKEAIGIHSMIQGLSKPLDKGMASPSDSGIQQRLKDCSVNYQDAIEQFEDSKKALNSKSYGDVNTWITSGMSDAVSCEEGFKEISEDASPLKEWYNKLNSLCSIVLKICDLLDAED